MFYRSVYWLYVYTTQKGDTDKERGGTSYAMLCARMTRKDATENMLELLIVLIHKSNL